MPTPVGCLYLAAVSYRLNAGGVDASPCVPTVRHRQGKPWRYKTQKPMQNSDSLPLSPAAPKTRVAWGHIVLAALGAAFSIYAIWAHGQIAAGGDAGCTINETFSCDEVLSSAWAKPLGIPLGYFGLIFWGIVAVTAVSDAKTSPRSAAIQRFVVALVGLGTSAFLFYISEFVIGTICPVCLTTHITSLLNFALAAVSLRKTRGAANS